MANISFYGSHNSSVAVEKSGRLLTVIEIERFLSVKNAGYTQYLPSFTRSYLITQVLSFIKQVHRITFFETCYFLNTDTYHNGEFTHYQYLIPAKKFIECLHHQSHAACGFYQTNFKKALIVSFDGGGNDGFFNLYLAANRKDIKLLKKLDIDLGFPYMSFGDYLHDIRKENSLSIGNLIYPGKLMGLSSYGQLNTDWLPYFEQYYKSKPDGKSYLKLLEELGKQTNLNFSVNKRFEGQTAWDIAKTSQIAFENCFIELVEPYLNHYPSLPLVLVGGCALNILLNTKLRESLKRPVFIPPNPNDCGLAAGMLLNHLQPMRAVDLTYSGIEILDSYNLMAIVEERRALELDLSTLAKDLVEGKIVGVVRGSAEHGPRALGNRSILCNPAFPEMKDLLNEKVKNREWFRPFAPVCRLEDVEKYFHFSGESRWMSFCPAVKEEWRHHLKAITHVDGTARIQTITHNQNPWLYALLGEFEKLSGFAVLLNTSFNQNGKPLVSRYSEALEVFNSTRLDRLVLSDFYFTK